ncbi:MAG: MBL fold metallo-hydrolase [Chloroflexi bacterium]|nr:MBL fold metallo-hydrolase [Chloroflexota bacterium]
MKVTLLGTGTHIPNPARHPSASVVQTPLGPWLLDCGGDAAWQMLRAGIQPGDVRHVIFTHLHSDHTLGFAAFASGGMMQGRKQLSVWGPSGTRRMVEMVTQFYGTLDPDAHAQTWPSEIRIIEYGTGTVFACPELTIDALPVRHSVETFALRFRAEGQMIVHSGDTGYHEPLAEFARGADILIHDGQLTASRMSAYTPERLAYQQNRHATPAQAARIARMAGAKRLVLTHLSPMSTDAEVLAESCTEFDGEIIVAQDLLTLECSEAVDPRVTRIGAN